MGTYSGIIEGLKAREVAIEEEIDAVRKAADVRIHDLTDERAAVEVARKSAEQLEKDFGGSLDPAPGEPAAAVPAQPTGGRSPSAPPSNQGRSGRGPGKKDRREDIEAIVKVLRGKGWVLSKDVKDAVGLSKGKFKDAVVASRERADVPTIESKGWARGAMYRIEGESDKGSTALAPPPPPPPAPRKPAPAAPPSNVLSGLAKQVYEYVRRHPSLTDSEIARGMGQGSKRGQESVSAKLRELAQNGKLLHTDHEARRYWRVPGAPPPRFGAAVQTKGADGATGEGSPRSKLEHDVLAAVKATSMSIEEIAEELGVSKESVAQVASAMVGRKILIRGIAGTKTVYGVPR